MAERTYGWNRRRFLRRSLAASVVLGVGPGLWGCSQSGSPRAAPPADLRRLKSNIPNLSGRLQRTRVTNDPSTEVWLPEGFTLREVARTGHAPAPGSAYKWHPQPDGGAVFAMPDGGWAYLSNSEVDIFRHGGGGALRFSPAGELVAAYSVCSGTTNNCAGGPTPWGTWLSCEEIDAGLVYECDPAGQGLAVPLPALGSFEHEAAAVDPRDGFIYMTEDKPDGLFYRFLPAEFVRGRRPDLRSGRLQALVVEGEDVLSTRRVEWVDVPLPNPVLAAEDPARIQPATRLQLPEAQRFNGGEGCWYHAGMVYFTTKGDNRVWGLDIDGARIDLVYDKASEAAFNPGIDDVDNLTVSPGGDILVAEDGAEMRLVVVGPDVKPFELVNIVGHRASEITGPAFSPDGSRLYFSSQQGPAPDDAPSDGRTYELRGPFFVPA